MNKIGRNDPCACGSGRKYKRCCMHAGTASACVGTASLQAAAEHHGAGRLLEAEACCQQMLAQQPEHAEALHLAGLIALQSGRNERAVEFISKAIGLQPTTAMHYNLAVALQGLSRLDEAIANYGRMIELEPRFADAHMNLGGALQLQGKLDAAIASYRNALAIAPHHVGARGNLGLALQELGKTADALACFEQALAINPLQHESHVNLGRAHQQQGNLASAAESYRRALAIRPDYAQAHSNLGSVLQEQGKADAALATYMRALTIRPDLAGAYSNLLFLQACRCALAPREYLERARAWEQSFVPEPERCAAARRAFERPPLAGRRLKVGYVSGDYRTHAVSYFAEQLFKHHDRTRIELYAYTTCGIQDEVTDRLRALAEHWVPLMGMSDAAVARRIETDGIDVLIDLSGHTANHRLQVFARRAAPVQVHYLGFFASTGLTEMDYFIGDAVLTPGETDHHFSEQVWRLPRIWVSYDGKPDAPLPAWTPDREGTVWVGSYNHLNKLTPATVALWAQVLHAVPCARLLLKTKQLADAGNRARILGDFSCHGIAADRIELKDGSATLSWASHMAYYDRLDIALDPVGGMAGGTTSCDALWMGVPVVTLMGDRMASRMTASMLAAIGHSEWIADCEAEYVEKVVALARDVAQRSALRGVQRSCMAQSPLCDARGLALSLEDAYFAMYERRRVPSTATKIDSAPLFTSSRRPRNARAHIKDAIAHHGAGRWTEAEAVCAQILARMPDHADALHLAGLIAQQSGRSERAVELLRKAIRSRPSSGMHYNLAVALQALSRLDEAIAHYRTALALAPKDADAHVNLGGALQQQGKLEAAAASYRQALAINPSHAGAHSNLGLALQELGQLDAALVNYEQALAINPLQAAAHNNLGHARKELGELEAAAASYRQALAIKPDYAEAHSNLGSVLQEQGKADAALASYRQALAIRPDFSGAHSNLLFLQAYRCTLDPLRYLASARAWELSCVPAPERSAAASRCFERALSAPRLRVGYVSGDYRTHAVSYFVEQLFRHHDRTRVELYAYSAGSIQDAVTDRLRGLTEHWLSVKGMSDAALRARIEADAIDVLVDLSGHTAHNRLGVFARRAAPVQVHYLGYFASTGLTEMDYFIGDEMLTPAAADHQHSERVWRLPRIWVCYEGKDEAPLPAWQPAADGAVWLGSFNNLNKLTPAAVALWAQVLDQMPQARLLLKTKQLADEGNCSRVLDEFAQHGIAACRIELADGSATPDWAAHMAYYDRLDIALDPAGGVGGGTTTCDALWMGVPVVSLTGERLASRMTASMLTAIDRPEWIAHSESEYVAKVVALAQDVAGRTVQRATQRGRMAVSTLCDAANLAVSLEDAYCAMHQRWTQERARALLKAS